MIKKLTSYFQKSLCNKLKLVLPLAVSGILIFTFIYMILMIRNLIFKHVIEEGKRKFSQLMQEDSDPHSTKVSVDSYFTDEVLYFIKKDMNGHIIFRKVHDKANLDISKTNNTVFMNTDDIIVRKINSSAGYHLELEMKTEAGSYFLGISMVHIQKLLLFQTLMLLGICILTVVAVMVIIISLVLLISNPLRNLAHEIEEHAKGENNLVPLSFADRQDEVGLLAQRFNHLSQIINKQSRLASIGQMTAEIAHDIRRPFNTIGKMLEILPQHTKDPLFIEKNKRSIEEAQENVNALLDDLMEYSKGNEITKIKTHLHDLIRSIFKGVERNYGEELNAIRLVYQSEFDVTFSVDIIKLMRAVTNIIHNAIEVLKEYEPAEKTIRIETSLGKNKEDKDCLHLIITNTGPAIDQEFLKEIFEPFKTKGKSNGTGLGLAIAKNVLIAHEGDLTVHTNIDGNVSFRLELPITKEALYDKPLELRAQGTKEDEASLPEEKDICVPDTHHEYFMERRKLGTVLVIDDDSIARDAVRFMIEKDEELCNLEVIEAEDGEHVLDLIEKHGVGYIVSDFQLGKHKLNGMEVLEKVKAHKQNVRVLLMSSYRTSEESFEALEKGAVNFIVKPVRRADILTLTKI